jgi:hypothetical protein
LYAQFGEDLPDVELDGVFGDVQPLGDLLVGQAADEFRHHRELARAEFAQQLDIGAGRQGERDAGGDRGAPAGNGLHAEVAAEGGQTFTHPVFRLVERKLGAVTVVPDVY